MSKGVAMATKGSSSKYTLIKKASSNMFVAVVIASILVSFSVVSIKFLLDLRSFNAEVQTQQAGIIDSLNQNITNYESLSEDYENFTGGSDLIGNQGDRDNTTVVLDALPSKYDYPAIVTALENITRISRVQLVGISGRDEVESAITSDPTPEPIDINMSIAINGNYRAIQRFMSTLERTIRPYAIVNVTFSGTDDDLRATFDLLTYYQPAVDVEEDVSRSITR